MSFSHINDNNQPKMVDVSAKKTTTRTATAKATMVLGEEVIHFLKILNFVLIEQAVEILVNINLFIFSVMILLRLLIFVENLTY